MTNVGSDQFIRARVAVKRTVARDVCEFTFEGPAGQPLPSWEPGAHIDVLTPAGERRSYSLTDRWPASDGRYVIAVARSADGRGGSASMHTSVRRGDTLQITPAVNTFPVKAASSYLLIAGGVGITPIRSMYHWIRASGDAQITLVYLVRSRREAAYVDEFVCDALTDVRVHTSEDGKGRRFDLWSVLRDPAATHLYGCASPGLIESVRQMTAHWRPSRLNFESFQPGGLDGTFTEPFEVTWQPTDSKLHVPEGVSLLDALRAAGIRVQSSCRSGTCGICRVALISGDVDHRDVILDEYERRSQMTSCVSRGATSIVVGPLSAGPVPTLPVSAGDRASSAHSG